MFLKVAYKISNFIAYLALMLGKPIIADSFDEAFDWIDHLLYIIGIYLWNREVINNKVVFSKTTGKSRLKTQFLSYGYSILLLILVIGEIVRKFFFHHELSHYEVVYLAMITMIAFTVAVTLICLVPFGDCLLKIKILHNDADILGKNLRIQPNFRITLLILTQIFYYCYLLLFTFYMLFKFIKEHGNFLVLVEYLCIVIAVICFTTILYLYCGSVFLCTIRIWNLNKYLRNLINGKQNRKNHYLYSPRSTNVIMEIVTNIFDKHSQIIQSVEKCSILPIMCMVHAYGIEISFLTYEYVFGNRLTYSLLSVNILGTFAFIAIPIFIQFYKAECNKTISIIIEWTLCYFNTEMTQRRALLLLQDIHYNSKFRYNYDGIISFTPNIWLMILELSIAFLLYFIQSFGTML